MTGPEHYREAERLLGLVAETPEDSVGSVAAEVAKANVHATLALAAATALNDAQVGMSGRDYGAWLEAAATKRACSRTRDEAQL